MNCRLTWRIHRFAVLDVVPSEEVDLPTEVENKEVIQEGFTQHNE